MSETLNNMIEAITPWFLEHGIYVLGTIIIAYVFFKFGEVFIEKIVRRVIIRNHNHDPASEGRREDTLIAIFSTTLKILIFVVAGMMVLQGIGVEIGPLLAAAGIAGVALGFGGQYLIRDLISGMFIIMENQYRIGDVIKVGTTAGIVEDITLRMTTLRDLDGTVHHIPHGEVTQVSNLTKTFARVNLDIGISYNANIEHVIEVVNRVCQELAEDPDWKDKIIETPKFIRVSDFADSSVIIKILGDTKPLEQWDVAGELRKRLKIAFDNEGIEIPFPQRVIHQAK